MKRIPALGSLLVAIAFVSAVHGQERAALAPFPPPLEFSAPSARFVDNHSAPVVDASEYRANNAPPAAEDNPDLPPVLTVGEYALPADRSSCAHHKQAGGPQQVAPWAQQTFGPKYNGYYVGGGKTPGSHSSGRPLRRDEGTFGVDYDPWYMRVALWSSNGSLFQGGVGQYEPDRKNRPLHQTFRHRFGWSE